MDELDFIHDMFSQACAISTVLYLVMAHFDLSEEKAQKKVDEYFKIVDTMDGGHSSYVCRFCCPASVPRFKLTAPKPQKFGCNGT